MLTQEMVKNNFFNKDGFLMTRAILKLKNFKILLSFREFNK